MQKSGGLKGHIEIMILVFFIFLYRFPVQVGFKVVRVIYGFCIACIKPEDNRILINSVWFLLYIFSETGRIQEYTEYFKLYCARDRLFRFKNKKMYKKWYDQPNDFFKNPIILC